MNIIKNFKFIKNTPLMYSERLSKLYNCNVYLKREDLQTTRSFKIRGAFNKIYNTIIKKNKKKYLNNMLYNNNSFKNIKIITSSAGNHAQGISYICDYFNIKCDIYIPKNTPKQKIESIKKYKNNNIIKYGYSFDEALKKCKDDIEHIDNNFINKIFIHPFDDIDVINGQGNILDEIYKKIKPDYICSAVGGGGLMAGLISNNLEINKNHFFYNHFINYFKLPIYNTKFIGVEPYNSSMMYESIMKNKIIKKDDICTFVDGASVKKVGNLTYNIIKDHINKIYRIHNEELCYDLVKMYQEDGIITELAGTLPISVLRHLDKEEIKNKNIVCIISGGNNDINRINDIIEKSKLYISR